MPSAVTIQSPGTLQGDGGTGTVTNLGGTYDATLYSVAILDSALQDASGTASGSVALSFASGQGSPTLGLSIADVVSPAFAVANSSDHFRYNSSYVIGGVNVGQALVDDTIGSSLHGDYFAIAVAADAADPIATADTFSDGVGGTLNISATNGLLANDQSQTAGSLSVQSVNGYTTPGTISTNDGTLTWYANGSFSYTPGAGFYGHDSFAYQVTDGTHASNTIVATIKVELPSLNVLDDANGDGVVNSTDGSPAYAGPGVVVLVSNDAADPSSDADPHHLVQLKINLDAVDHIFETLPNDLTGWTLKLDGGSAGTDVKFWDSSSKTTELDTNGQVSWDLGGGLSSVPTTLFVDADEPGDYEIHAHIDPSSSSIPGEQFTLRIIAGYGTLWAHQASVNGGTVTTASMLPRNVQLTQGAYVPLSNEDQKYEETPALDGMSYQTDKDRTDAISGDKFLLPVDIISRRGPSSTAGTYELLIPVNLRVWTNPDRTGEIGSGQALSLNSSGLTTVYVEGLADGASTIQLLWDQIGGEWAIPDSLKVTVFNFTGQQNVPNYSIYQYGVEGLAATPGESWSPNNDGRGPEDSPTTIPDQTNVSASVYWGTGAYVGSVAYTVNPYYTWSYYANIVAITISNPATAAFRGTSHSPIRFPTSTSSIRMAILPVLHQMRTSRTSAGTLPVVTTRKTECKLPRSGPATGFQRLRRSFSAPRSS